MLFRSLNPGHHAVLASLSGRYPPLEGRSPTRYSPVRHSTQDRSPFRVRLACVRHAASVDSEPGSNSQVEFLRERLGSHYLFVTVLCWLVLLRTADTRRAGCARLLRSSYCEEALKLSVHALSSFQRTKDACDLIGRSPRTRHPVFWMLLRPFLGEPSKLTTASLA